MPSGPVALVSLIEDRSVSTPFLDTLILGRFEGAVFGRGVKPVGLSGSENTLKNWSLKMFAFALAFWIILLLSMRSPIPTFSFL